METPFASNFPTFIVVLSHVPTYRALLVGWLFGVGGVFPLPSRQMYTRHADGEGKGKRLGF